jgi:fructose-1,6-bisphosphatase/inositol monophosphatase family enzyme
MPLFDEISKTLRGEKDGVQPSDEALFLHDLNETYERVKKAYEWDVLFEDPYTIMAARFCLTLREVLRPHLRDQHKLIELLGNKVRDKQEGQTNYDFDFVGELVLKRILEETSKEQRWHIGATSEEEGSKSYGDQHDPIVRVWADPVDGSEHLRRGYRDAAVAITIADAQYAFKACAIADLATDALYLGFGNEAWVYYINREVYDQRELRVSDDTSLAPPYSCCLQVGTIAHAHEYDTLPLSKEKFYEFRTSSLVGVGRLAQGSIQAIIRSVTGYPIHEIGALQLVVNAGGIVKDNDGTSFEFKQVIQLSPTERYCFVAACTEGLWQELTGKLKAKN